MMSDKCKKKRLLVDYNTMQQIAKKANASVSVYIKAENETAKKIVSDTDGNKISYSINKSFSKQVDEVLNGLFDKTNMLYVTSTNMIIQKVLDNDYPILMTSTHIETTYFAEGNRKNMNYHGYGELIKQIPEAIQKPIMVIQSSSKPLNNAIFITKIKDRNGHNLIAPIDVDTTGMYNNVKIDANVLDTFYAKDDIKGFLEKITGDDILYLDNKKANKFLTRKGSNCPTELESLMASYIVYAKVIKKSIIKQTEII